MELTSANEFAQLFVSFGSETIETDEAARAGVEKARTTGDAVKRRHAGGSKTISPSDPRKQLF